VEHQFGRQAALAHAAHLVRVPPVVADHLGAFVGDVLGDGGQGVGEGEDLEVAVDFGVEARAVDDHVGGGFQDHLFHGERIAQDVLGEVLQVGLGLGRHLLTGMQVEPAVFPGTCERRLSRKEAQEAQREKSTQDSRTKRIRVVSNHESAAPGE